MNDTTYKYEYVDLGLPSGTLWATCNIGATSPEQAGKYFQWGDTVGYSTEELGIGTDDKIPAGSKQFDWPDYKWSINGSSNKFSKYNATDRKMTLDPEDDAAHVNMGGSWRMPTKAEIMELINGTTNEWIKLNGVNGRRFTSKAEGNTNSIFIPAGGYLDDGSHCSIGSNGFSWVASLYPDSINNARCFFSGSVSMHCYGRYFGLAVRGVISKKKKNKFK